MPRKIPRALWLVLPLAYFLYLYHLAAVGLMGPDEPRYAAISRAMAASGDWVTPRLLGQPWFEKPALLYWMEAAFFRAGFGAELASRLPVALLALAFLGFYWWILRREFGGPAAACATAILGTSAAWFVASQIGTTDLILAATYSAAMLLALPWVRRRDPAWLPWVAVLLGLAVLAKGPVAAVLAVPLLVPWKPPFGSTLGGNLKAFLHPRVVLPFLAVSVPWYVLCARANGEAFLRDFFWKHNVERFVSASAVGQHGQPFWWFGPVLLGLLLPWTPLLPLAARRTFYSDHVRLYLLVWASLWLIFFSTSANKLPFYILPMIPAAAALLGLALAEAHDAARWLAACALLLIAIPVAAPIFPTAVAAGLSHAPSPHFEWTWLLPVAVAVLVWKIERRGQRLAAVMTIAAAAALGCAALKFSASDELDRLASARDIWTRLAPESSLVCVEWVPRGMEESLRYYFQPPLPQCGDQPRPVWLHQAAGQLPAWGPSKRNR